MDPKGIDGNQCMVQLKVQYLLQSNPNQFHNLPPFLHHMPKFTMGLDGGQSIGMPKSSSERSSKSEFSDSEFVFEGVKFNGGIDMGDGGGERDGDLEGDSYLGVERGGLGGGGEGDLGGRWGFGLWRL